MQAKEVATGKEVGCGKASKDEVERIRREWRDKWSEVRERGKLMEGVGPMDQHQHGTRGDETEEGTKS